MAGAKSAIAARRVEPGDDLLDGLIRVQAEDGDRLSDAEMVTLVWHPRRRGTDAYQPHRQLGGCSACLP